MNLEESVREACTGLKSVRATERKKNAERLKEFLTRNAVPSLLTNNTLRKSGYQWNHVFDDINDYIMKETEKFESSKTFFNVTAPLCKSLLHSCVAAANKDCAYIKCDKITEACIYILNDNRLTQAVGDAYLSLLYKYILTNNYYVGYITPASWEKLMDVCILECLKSKSKLDDVIKIKLVWSIIKNASSCCQFTIPLRDSLSKLKECCLKMINDKKVQDVIIEIIILLLELLSLECRLTMCEFVEMILPMIFKFYEQSMEQKKKSLFFKLLNISIVIHHPLGRAQNINGSLAFDWITWNKHVHSILEIVCLEINYAQKSRKQNENLTQCYYFYHTAASIFFQIFNMLEEYREDEAGPSVKRQRLLFNKNKSFMDLVEELRSNCYPWIGIILTYVKEFHSSIVSEEYILLLVALENMVVSNNKDVIWEHFGDLICIVIKNLIARPDYRLEDNQEVLIAMWNTCSRNSTIPNTAQKAVHKIMQEILILVPLKYHNVQPLFVSYLEKGMPVNNYSLRTLNLCFNKFYKKSCTIDVKTRCFKWLTNENIAMLDTDIVKEFLTRLLCNENLPIKHTIDTNSDNVYDVIFFNKEKSMLHSEFEYEIAKEAEVTTTDVQENFQINNEMYNTILTYLEQKITNTMREHKSGVTENSECSKYVTFILIFFDSLLKHNLKTYYEVRITQLYSEFQNALRNMFTALTQTLTSDLQIRDKVVLLKYVQDILLNDYDALLNTDIREYFDEDCLHSVFDIIKREICLKDDETYYESEIEYSAIGLKQNCIYFLATYCMKQSIHTSDIVKCILDSNLYNFTCNFDIDCAFRCIEILNERKVEQSPSELIFSLMQDMCRELLRNPGATGGLLKILDNIIEKIWHQDDDEIRQNCIIMLKGYLHMSKKMPSSVAAIVYKCVAKVIIFNNKQDVDLHRCFERTLIDKITGNDHCVRLYCCHLLTLIASNFRDEDIELLCDNLSVIFIISISDKKETVMKDETMNRTIAVLHCFYNLATARKSLLHYIIIKVLLFQNDKAMDKKITKKMLNLLIENLTTNTIELYFENNILHVLYYWFEKKKTVENLPLYLFGFNNLDIFIERHIKWLVSTDILWRHNGIEEKSDVFKKLKIQTKKTDEDLIEMCFCHIISLCLPYIVVENYKIENENYLNFETKDAANKMFHKTRKILKDDKWSNLFVENLGEILLLLVRQVNDPVGAAEMFQVRFLNKPDPYAVSENVFPFILNYFGELIDGNILQYLCDNQPLVILDILFNLWDGVLREKVYEFKVLMLHAYLSFVDHIPLGHSSDAILCNFLCTSVAYAINDSQCNKEIKIFVIGMKRIFRKILSETPQYIENIQLSTLSKIVSILNIKIEKGYYECKPLLTYLTKDLKEFFTKNPAVIDYIKLMSDDMIIQTSSASKVQFLNELKSFLLCLPNASQSTLFKICECLKHNSKFIKELYLDLNLNKGFSEECENSLIHKAISSLAKLLKTEYDEKIYVEACNCLAEIGTYDMKTLVTVPPADTTKIISLNPKQYFTISALKTLSDHLFDHDPTVSSKVAKAINCLLKFRDGKEALNMIEIDKAVLKSLLSTNCEDYADYKIDSVKFVKYNSINFWKPNKDETHSQWITRITLALLDLIISSTNFSYSLSSVCAVKPKICRIIMPALFGLILYCSTDTHIKVFGKQINEVFHYLCNLNFDGNFENSGDCDGFKKTTNLNKDHKIIVVYLLEVVNFVRIQRKHYTIRLGRQRLGEGSDPLNYLQLQYSCVSLAAARADRHVAALYYGELTAANQPVDETALSIFRKCYVSIGEMDAIDGCGIAHLTSDEERRKHLINTGQFTDALLLHDIGLSRGVVNEDLMFGAATSLHKAGMHHLALQYIQSCPENDKLDNVKYDCLSYLGDWSDFVDTSELEEKSKKDIYNKDSLIKALRYACLKDCLNLQISTEANNKLQIPLKRAKLAVVSLCKNLNMENCQNVYKIVANLHLFRDIDRYFSVRCNKRPVSQLIDEWKVENLPNFNDFKHLETLMSQRSLILEHIAKTDYTNFAMVNELQLQYAELGLNNNNIQMAQRIVATVRDLKTSQRVVLLESQIAWAKGHKNIALSLLGSIVTQESDDHKLTAMSLRQYGLWMAETKRETARDIIHKYLEKSLKVLGSNDDVETRLKAYYDIAKFADAEYKQVVSYMNSSVFKNKVKCMKDMKGTVASLISSQKSLPRRGNSVFRIEAHADIRVKCRVNNVFTELDEAEIANIKAEKESFLRLAMRYYLLSLKHCDENNLSVFRVISLWLDNPDVDFGDEETGRFGQLLQEIPSWKFITVLPQLAPRLSSESTPLAEHLRRIMTRCATEHPHHTLPMLLSLKNSDRDDGVVGGAGSVGVVGGVGGAGSVGGAGGEARVVAASALVRQLAAGPLRSVVEQADMLADAIISFSYYVPKSKDLKPQAVPQSELIHKLRDLDAIPNPTDTIPIRKDCDYSRLNTISCFEKSFELVGGINCPKKICCLSTDGKKRILLMKGKDDLRQDAVMQQVFNIVNTLLEKSPVTKRNKLSVRTYKVVPMSRRSGVLQWCEGTIPLGGYLINAHTKYRPKDIKPMDARTKLKTCQDEKKPTKYKLEVFKEILKVFKPVFHYFFTEHYLDPVTWYERRLAYTRSVATSSMVGYILGIGDRHVQNILIDKTTAELIHIDFGIAFDQGKTLPTPETVPFRLTQDIIAGFGSSGVEGTFRRCCEKTLQLLRDNQETLLTILEVLLCDPLYLWIIPENPKEKASNSPGEEERGGGGGGGGAGLAARALLAVSSKLCGVGGGAGGGAGGGVSVPGHVARLLRAAADPANLCQLFHGWQPYL